MQPPWQARGFSGGFALGIASAAVLTALTRKLFWGLWLLFTILLAAGWLLQEQWAVAPAWFPGAMAVASIVVVAAILSLTIRYGHRSRELERVLFADSTSIAFFATMIGAVTYALLETWLDAPRVSMWLVWVFGMGSWFLASVLLGRRYS